MAEKIALELDINAKGATTSLGQLEQEAERLNEELRKVPLGSQAFKDLKNELVGVSKEIKNTELSMEALDNEQVASELGSVAGAVGDVSAAFILLGGSGGPIEETVQNIEKAIGVSMAFKGAIEGTQSGMKLFNNVVKNSTAFQKANNATTVIASGVMKLFTGSVNTTSTAFKGLKTAIAATGIGLLVVGLAALIANFDKLKAAMSGVSKASDDLVLSTKETNKLNEKNLETLNNQTNILKAQGFTERQILKMKLDGQKKIVDGLIAEIEAQKIVNEEKVQGSIRNQNILKKTVEFLLIVPRTLLKLNEFAAESFLKLINKVTQSSVGKKLFGFEPINVDLGLTERADELLDRATRFIFDPEATELEGQKEIEILEENLLKQRDALAGFELGILDLNKKAAETKKAADNKAQTEADKRAADARAKRLEEQAIEAQDLADFLLTKEQLENEYFDSKLSKEQQEVNAVREKYFDLIEQAKLYGDDIAVLEEAQQTQINEIKKRYADEEDERVKEFRQKSIQDGLDVIQNFASQSVEKYQSLNEQVLEDEKTLNKQILDNQNLTEKQKLKQLEKVQRDKQKLLDANNKRAEKVFNIQKKASIAAALITTYQSAVSAYQSQFIPIPDPSSPIRGGIAAGLAVAAGLANVNQIRKQKFTAATLGGVPNISGNSIGTGGGGEAPVIGPANTSTLTGQEPQRVFVTETDITNTQNNVAVIEGQSTFGN